MTPTKKSTKRRLPPWMEAVSCNTKDVPDAPKASDSVKSQSEASGSILVDSVTGDKKHATDNVEDKLSTRKKPKFSKTFLVSKSQVNGSAELNSAQNFIAQSMPLLTFKGEVIYSYQDADCACICQDIISSLSETEKTVIGFDMEWPVSFRQGSSDKTALVQMCLSETQCYLFHVSAMYSFPKLLKNIILHPCVILTGLNVESDLWKLERDFDVRVKPIIDRGAVVDVGKIANKVLKSSEKWALDGLCRNVLRQRLDKDAELRCGNWSEVPLTKQQKLYAATDAYAGLLLYKHLIDK